ncbi:MAG: hypothetical protein IKS83_08255 [Victivallales bacterium]|nr:hypothetical protein [Victivallales bacterium]
MTRCRFITLVLVVLCSLPLLAAKKETPVAVTETAFWFNDVTQPMPLSEEQGIELVKQLRTGMLARKSIKDVLASIPYDYPSPRVLFLTLGDGIFPGRTYYAAGSSFKDALARLLAIVAKREPEYAEAIRGELEGQIARAREEYENMTDAQRQQTPPNPLLQNPLPENLRRKMQDPLRWNSLRLDVVQATLPVQNFVIAKSRLLLTNAVGIAFDSVAAFAFTPEQLKGRCLVTSEHQLSVVAVSNLIAESNLWSAWQLWTQMASSSVGFNVTIFESDCYYADEKGAARLFRGHPACLRRPLVTAGTLDESSRALAGRLCQMWNANGKYEQPFPEWFPARDDGQQSITDQAQLTLALARAAALPELPEQEREKLRKGAVAAAKPILKAIKHFDPGELGPHFAENKTSRRPASQRFYAAVVEDENLRYGFAGAQQMEIPRRLMDLATSANAYLALAELWQALPEDDKTGQACRAELRPLVNYILTQIYPNGEFVARRDYPGNVMCLEDQPTLFGRVEIISQCGLVLAKHLELFPEQDAELNLKENVRLLQKAATNLALTGKGPEEYPMTPWLMEFLAVNAAQTPENLAHLMRLGMAAVEGLEKKPFLPDMFGVPVDMPSMTYAAERLWMVCVAVAAIGQQADHTAEAIEILREAWPLLVFMQQARMDSSTASALPCPDEYVGFYRDNLADFGFTMNGQITQLLARLRLSGTLVRLGLDQLEPLPEDAAAYETCWLDIDRHPMVLTPDLVIQSAIAGAGNDRALGGRIDVSRMQSRQLTGDELQRLEGGRGFDKNSRVIPRRK